MVLKIIIGYLIFQVILLIILFAFTNFTDKKSSRTYLRPNEVPEGFQKTKETFLDPKTNNVIYVYYNEMTGERIYVEH